MKTDMISMKRDEAKRLYEQYRGAPHFGEGMDREIARAYRLLSQGKLIIRALESVKSAGLGEDGLPKLAILPAHNEKCWLTLTVRGSADFRGQEGMHWREANRVRMPEGTFAPDRESFAITWRDPQSGTVHRAFERQATAIVPIIPVHLRPKPALSNYHILWEADWQDVPRDPLLVQRLGKGDLWLVLAAWDLTEVERAAMRARV